MIIYCDSVVKNCLDLFVVSYLFFVRIQNVSLDIDARFCIAVFLEILHVFLLKLGLFYGWAIER